MSSLICITDIDYHLRVYDYMSSSLGCQVFIATFPIVFV